MSDKTPTLASRLARGALRLVFRPANPLTPAVVYVDEMQATAKSAIASVSKGFKPDTVNPKEQEALARFTDDAERFRGAMRYYRVNDAQVADMERGASTRLIMFFIAFALSLFFAIVAPRFGLIGRSYLPALDILLPWMMSAVLLAKCARTSFHLYQLRRRSLVGVREWLHDPSAWLGGAPSLMIGLMLMTWVAMSPTEASAQTATAQSISNFSTWASAMLTNHDLSVQWLTKLFPGAAFMWGGTTTATDDFAPLFALVNGLLFVLASASLTWFTFLGLVNTAHSGKVLGDKYHQIWAPIRVLMGVTFLFPVKGYCLAQLVALWIIFSGYAVANGVWTTYVANAFSGTVATSTFSPSVDIGRNLAIQILEAETCAQTLSAMNQNMASSLSYMPVDPLAVDAGMGYSQALQSTVFTAPSPTKATNTLGTSTTWNYGPVCGSIRIDASTQSVSGMLAVAGTAINPNDSATMQDQLTEFQTFDTARLTEVTNLISGIRLTGLPALMAQLVTPKTGAPAPDISQTTSNIQKVFTLATTFDTNIVTAAKAMGKNLDKDGQTQFQATANDLGWASAGAMNATLTRYSAAVMDTVQGAMPTIISPDLTSLGKGETLDQINKAQTRLNTLIKKNDLTDFNGRTAVQLRGDFKTNNPLAFFLKAPLDRLANSIVSSANINAINPMDEMVSIGNTAMVAGSTLLVVGAAASGAAENGKTTLGQIASLGVATFGAGAFTFIAPFLLGMAGALLFFGALHAYVLPLVAYIIWMFAVLGCAAYTVEVVIAAPIAAFLHVRFDGTELIDQPQKGIYILTFNAAFRPTLLLFGLIASTKIFAVMCSYLNTTFAVAMFASQGNDVIGPIGIFTMYMLLMYLHFQIAIKSMSLVHQIPAMVSHVLGAPDGERHEREGMGVVVGAVGSFGRNATATVASNVMGGGGKKKPPGGGEEPGGTGGGDKGATANVAKTVSTGVGENK